MTCIYHKNQKQTLRSGCPNGNYGSKADMRILGCGHCWRAPTVFGQPLKGTFLIVLEPAGPVNWVNVLSTERGGSVFPSIVGSILISVKAQLPEKLQPSTASYTLTAPCANLFHPSPDSPDRTGYATAQCLSPDPCKLAMAEQVLDHMKTASSVVIALRHSGNVSKRLSVAW
jgi:hypothetical protein